MRYFQTNTSVTRGLDVWTAVVRKKKLMWPKGSLLGPSQYLHSILHFAELPDTSFTRSISNPEAVMRRRRQQKLEKKLQQFRSRDGGPDTGGTLKIYGESLRKDVPYKTLLVSVSDPAVIVVEEMLDKYALDRKEAPNFCLVQITTPPGGEVNGSGHHAGHEREYYLEDDECPLAILMNHPPSRGRF